MNVLELFAGVGGFRIGLENSDKNFSKQDGVINGNLPVNLKMLLKFTITTSLIVKILDIVYQIFRMKNLPQWMLI